MLGGSVPTLRVGLQGSQGLWGVSAGGSVAVSPPPDKASREVLLRAFAEFERFTCIRFVAYRGQRDFISIIPMSGYVLRGMCVHSCTCVCVHAHACVCTVCVGFLCVLWGSAGIHPSLCLKPVSGPVFPGPEPSCPLSGLPGGSWTYRYLGQKVEKE